MGYYIRELSEKKSRPKWKIQFVSYKKKDTRGSRAQKPKREWDIEDSRWPALGFNKLMTLNEARGRAKQLNSRIIIRNQEERIRKIRKDQKNTQLRYLSVLPPEFVLEFEHRFVREQDSLTEQGKRKTTRAFVLWNAAQKMIATLPIDPSEWFYHTHEFYDYFCDRKMSPKYVSSILKMANLWGFYYSRKLSQPFLELRPPSGYERQRLISSYYEKTEKVRRPSLPITPIDLERVKGNLNRENFNWIFLSVWLGLRPMEIDSMKNRDHWRLEVLPTGRKLLWVFQTKIIALPPEDRWKPIPILFSEQHFALRIIESGNFKRPILQTMRRHFGRGATLWKNYAWKVRGPVSST